MKPFLVDVPVRVQVWNRPDCQKKQLEVLKKARPSVLFLISDGGRTEKEQALINQSRQIMEDIDWECTVHKLYMDQNMGMYGMSVKVRELIWSKVDRCVFLEDDYVPAVSFFRYCAELLEKYRDDLRVEMITGFNPFGVYDDALPNDYFFVENGWAIWGLALWKRTVEKTKYPLPYADNQYVKDRLKEGLNPLYYKRVEDYSNGILSDGHIPGSEYYYAVNTLLYHSVAVVPTKNMICNIGVEGAHAGKSKIWEKYNGRLFNSRTYELEGEIKHPEYMIADKHYEKMYDDLLLRGKHSKIKRLHIKVMRFFELLFSNQISNKIKSKAEKRKNGEK